MPHSFATFSPANQRQLLRLIAGHLLWSGAIFGLWAGGQLLEATPWWTAGLIALQLFVAAQLLLPVLLLHPEDRTRGFYLFWLLSLGLCIWLLNQLPACGLGLPLLAALKSSLLLLVATVIGAALARYVQRLWEIVPVCLVMTFADLASWLFGPTAGFMQDIKQYCLNPEGPPPLIDMLLIKLAFPGAANLKPVFGISDWIMVVFFAIVAKRFGVNDNLIGASGETLAQTGRIGRYLPLSVAALLGAMLLAHLSGLMIPALPVIALSMLLWYAARSLRLRFAINNKDETGHE